MGAKTLEDAQAAVRGFQADLDRLNGVHTNSDVEEVGGSADAVMGSSCA